MEDDDRRAREIADNLTDREQEILLALSRLDHELETFLADGKNQKHKRRPRHDPGE